jgi:hypothetical protein
MRSAGADPAAVTAMLARTMPTALAEGTGSVEASRASASNTQTGVAHGAVIASAAAKQERNISFDDPVALNNILDKAAFTFASWTKRDAKSNLAFCPEGNAAPAPTCWVYREQFDSPYYLEVWEQLGASHFHLSFDNPFFWTRGWCQLSRTDSTKYGSGWGVPRDSSGTGPCLGVYWERQPRHLVSHDETSWIQVTMENGRTGQLRNFDLANLQVSGDQPIQLWFRASDGSVWGYNRLNAGQDYRLEFLNIVAVWISGASGATRSYSIDRILVRG